MIRQHFRCFTFILVALLLMLEQVLPSFSDVSTEKRDDRPQQGSISNAAILERSAVHRLLGMKYDDMFPDYPALGPRHSKKHKKNKVFAVPQPMPYPVPVPAPAPPPSPVEVHPPPKPTKPEYTKKEVVVTTDADFSCPDDFLLQGEKCVKYDQQKTKLGCKEGWQFQGGMCKGVDVLPPTTECDPGYERYHNSGCRKAKIAPKQILCQDGFELAGNHCIKAVHTAADMRCQEGYVYVGNECYKRDTVNSQLTCSPGFTLVHNQCRMETILPGRHACHPGFFMVNGKCEKQLKKGSIPNCPQGYRLEGDNCVLSKTLPAAMACHKGVLSNSVCRSKYTERPAVECTKGYELSAGGEFCVLEATVPPEPYCLGGSGGGKHSSYGLVTVYYDAKSGKCVEESGKKKKSVVTTSLPEYRCPPGHRFADKHTCVETRKKAPNVVCPPMMVYSNLSHLCEKEESSQAHPNCPGGYTLLAGTTSCQKTVVAPVKYGCKEGYSYSGHDNSCVTTISDAATVECEPGFAPTTGGSGNPHDGKGGLQQPLCRKVEALQPVVNCPPGYAPQEGAGGRMGSMMTASSSSSGGKGGFFGGGLMKPRMLAGVKHSIAAPTCVGELRRPAMPVCPPNYELRDSSSGSGTGKGPMMMPSSTNQGVVCVGQSTSMAQIQCPANFTDIDGNCTKFEFVQLRSVCPTDYHIVGDQCVQHLEESPVVMCPRSYSLYQGICVKQMFSKPTPICPPDYKFDHLVGQCFYIRVDYDFENRGEALLPASDAPTKEALLDLEITTTPRPVTVEQVLPVRQQPLPTVQIVQQPIPIPSPVVYLPRQAPPPPPLPKPVPVPVPIPVAQPPQKVEVIREKPVPYPVPVAHHQTILAVGPKKHKNKKHHSPRGVPF